MEHLDGEMRRGSKPEKAHPLSGLCARDTQAAKSNDARTEQRGSVEIIEFGWKRKYEIGARQRILRIAAIDGIAGKSRRIAEILVALAAVPARSVGSAEPGDTHTGSERQLWSCAFHNVADNLVPGNNLTQPRRKFAFDDVEVGPAHAAGANFQQNVAGQKRRTRNFFDSVKAVWQYPQETAEQQLS